MNHYLLFLINFLFLKHAYSSVPGEYFVSQIDQKVGGAHFRNANFLHLMNIIFFFENR